MPLAIEQLDVAAYDIVISSSHAVAKGILAGPDQLHICMCYSPIRFAWDMQHQYLKETGLDFGFKGVLARWLLHKIRLWDVRTANGVDQFIAISQFIGRRIQKAYRRDSVVIYPPVDVAMFELCEDKDNFYLTASRMVPYKKIPLIVQAFAKMPDKQLVVIGDGPDLHKVKALAGPNVKILGYQSAKVLNEHMKKAKAFVFAAEEDFGIAPLEAQACGTPVIAFGKGGALETIRGQNDLSPTGIFFDEQSVDSLVGAVTLFEQKYCAQIYPKACRDNATRFSQERFQSEFKIFIEEKWNEFQKSIRNE
jgi:glycosyltransferase involved in cell wall biosynthesis